MLSIIQFILCCIVLISFGILDNNNNKDGFGDALQILSKSKLEKCETSSVGGDLNCTRKILVNIAIPSNSSGGESSMVAEVVEVEENSTDKMQTLRVPPVITINKSAAYALFELTYIRDVPYKPQEFYVQTRKCEPDADARIVRICERLRDDQGHIIEASEPICCPCGDRRRVPSSCGNFFDKILKGKANTAHCLRFPGDWFHVFGIGQRTLGFSIRIVVKTASKVSEVIVGPENRTAISNDDFLRVNLIGDFAGYTNIPSFEDFYLTIPRQHGPGQPPDLGKNITMWMLLERVRFTLDGIECNKIGVGYEAFNGQPDFCSSPFWSCLHNQLWNFFEADQNRIGRNQPPLYGVVGRFERINDHPGAGPRSFSIGITEALNTNLLIELAADDIEYVYQRSPGKILAIIVPTFEALAQFGIARIEAKNVGEVEASYSLTFQCSKGITMMEEQFFIMKPNEVVTRSFKINPTTDQAAKYACSAILKDSDFKEVDRAECQFTTTATGFDNGSQGPPFQPPTSAKGFFESIKNIWNKFWSGLSDFITGKSCRSKCSGLFDFQCHIQYVCIGWVLMLGLFLSVFPTVLVLLWLLHQKGFFDAIYDWWEDRCCWDDEEPVQKHHRKHRHRVHQHELMNRNHRRKNYGEHRHHRHGQINDHDCYLHRVHKDGPKQKHGGRHRNHNVGLVHEAHLDREHGRRKDRNHNVGLIHEAHLDREHGRRKDRNHNVGLIHEAHLDREHGRRKDRNHNVGLIHEAHLDREHGRRKDRNHNVGLIHEAHLDREHGRRKDRNHNVGLIHEAHLDREHGRRKDRKTVIKRTTGFPIGYDI